LSLNRVRVILVRGCVCGVVGLFVGDLSKLNANGEYTVHSFKKIIKKKNERGAK